MDYGYLQKDLSADNIYDVDPQIKKRFFFDKLPDFAIECALVKIQPKARRVNDDPSQIGWHGGAIRTFQKLLKSSTIAKVRPHQ